MTAPEQRSDAKRRLLEKLLRGEVSRQNREAPIEPRAAGAPAPLAPGQHLIWLSSQMTATEPIYNAPITIHHRGRLDREVLQRTFHEFARRHEILRTSFASINGEVVQAVHDHLTIQIPFLDLSKLSKEQGEEKANEVAVADSLRLFDLGVGPLIRARLVKLEPEYHRLYVTVHHIIFDGVSIYNVLLPELAAIYEAFAAGEVSPLAEPRYQYSDFALWQKRMLDNDSVARQIDYWREQLAGELPDLLLPTDRPRPAVHSYRGAMKPFAVPAELTAALRTAARDEGVTLYMFLLTAFKTLLHRYSGQEDIMMGGVSGARRRPEFQKLMGNFSNFFVLRTHPAAQSTFREYLATVKDIVLGALANGDVPLDQVIREVQPRRESARRPFFQVTFSMEPLPAESAGPDWWVTQMDTVTGFTKFDLYFEIDERPDGLFARFDYSAELFDRATIDRITQHWLTLLQSAIENPLTKLCDLAMIPADEEHQLRVDWNDTWRAIPSTTVHGLFEQQAERTPNAIAVEAAGVRLTYKELDERANRLASRLRQAGVTHGTLVALCVDRTVDMAAAPLAVLKAGGAYLPLDPEFPKERLAFLMEDAEAPVLLTIRSLAGLLPGAEQVVFCDGEEDSLGSDKKQGDRQPFSPANVSMDPAESSAKKVESPRDSIAAGQAHTPESIAYVLYTSGSTGRPKGVGIHHRALVNLLLSMQREPGFTASDSLLAVTTLSFDIAELELYLPLICGGRLVIASHEDARDLRRLGERLRESKCTVLQATPAAWRGLIDIGWTGQAGLKALCGGETLSRDLAQELLPRVGELWNLYGPTETAVWSAAHKVTAGNGPVPIGRPIDNTEIFVLDANQKLAPTGVAGELYIGGAGVARGYVRREELTAERFIESPFHSNAKLYRTGDLARWRTDGTLECLGRIDNQIKIRGFRIEPGEIEAALLEHEEIRTAAVRVWPDASGNLSIAAYLTGGLALERIDLRRFLKQQLPDYMIPARFVTLDALPLTPNGKVDRNALPDPSAMEKAVVSIAARNEMERKLVAIWESVLDARPIGIEDNFFDLGAHSFQVAKLLHKIEVEFGARLSMAALFEAPTISSLAELLGDRSLIARVPRVSNMQPAGALEPLFWIYGGPIVRSLAGNLGTQRPFLGVGLEHGENEDLAGCTFQEIAARLARIIRAQQPHGPYHLGGWCISGLLAYEIASQLIAAGEKVGLVVMVDAVNPAHYFKIPKYRLLASKAAYHLRRLMRTEIGNALAQARRRVPEIAKKLFAGPAAPENPFLEALNTAVTHYDPKPIPARVLAVQPTEHPEIWNLYESWAPHIARGEFEVREVSGDHLTMFEEPNVAALARCINKCLRNNVVEIRRAAAG
jgi:amino acid adenylation domain-containing protein